jgi:2-keto-myo-inositol isomerase
MLKINNKNILHKENISYKENVFCLDTYVIRDKNCIGYCCIDPKNLYEKIQIASEAGYQAVELWHKDVFEFKKKFGLQKINKLCNDKNIFVSSYKVIEDWFEANPRHDKINEIIETAAEIGSKSIVVKLLNDNKIQEQKPISFFIEKYLELIKKCSIFNVNPSIEFMALANFMNSIEDVYKILEKTNGGNLVLDTWHLWRKDNENFDRFERFINKLDPKWISVIHFTDADSKIKRENQKDGNRKLPTFGCLNLNKFCALMKRINFNGVYSLNVYDQSLWDMDPLEVASKGLYLMKSCFINKSLLDSKDWNQVERCDGLWSKQYYTHLDPRIKKTNRDEKLEEILKSIIENKIILDFKCGFSPLANYVRYGFDAFDGCIEYLKNKHPQAEWICCSDEEFVKNFKSKIDVLMHLGLGDSNTEIDGHFIIRKNCNPKIVIIECAANSDGTVNEAKSGSGCRWNLLKKDLKNIQTFFYETNMGERNYRLLLIGEV